MWHDQLHLGQYTPASQGEGVCVHGAPVVVVVLARVCRCTCTCTVRSGFAPLQPFVPSRRRKDRDSLYQPLMMHDQEVPVSFRTRTAQRYCISSANPKPRPRSRSQGRRLRTGPGRAAATLSEGYSGTSARRPTASGGGLTSPLVLVASCDLRRLTSA